jgi:hypothetical protein
MDTAGTRDTKSRVGAERASALLRERVLRAPDRAPANESLLHALGPCPRRLVAQRPCSVATLLRKPWLRRRFLRAFIGWPFHFDLLAQSSRALEVVRARRLVRAMLGSVRVRCGLVWLPLSVGLAACAVYDQSLIPPNGTDVEAGQAPRRIGSRPHRTRAPHRRTCPPRWSTARTRVGRAAKRRAAMNGSRSTSARP